MPRRDADAVYKAFRAACDSLFAKRDDARDAEANAHRAELDALKAEIDARARRWRRRRRTRDRGAREGARARRRELAERVEQMVRHVIATARRGGAGHRARSRSRCAPPRQADRARRGAAAEAAPRPRRRASTSRRSSRTRCARTRSAICGSPAAIRSRSIDELRDAWVEAGPILDEIDRAQQARFEEPCEQVLDAARAAR